MFNLDLTGYFVGPVPNAIPIPSGIFRSAVEFYKAALRAKEDHPRRRGSAALDSEYGFRLRLYCIPANQTTHADVRLQLPQKVSRRSVAARLAAGREVKTTRAGLRVTDPFGVTWTLP